MVQLPEPTDYEQFSTIAEIGRERIRRAAALNKPNQKEDLRLYTEGDLGFRCYTLTHSNFKDWIPYENRDTSQLEILFDKHEIPLVDGWTPNTLLVEILLIHGFPLDSQTTFLDAIENNSVYRIHSEGMGHEMIVCLDEEVYDETIQKLNLRSEDILVCLDSALSDEVKIRLADQTNMKVI